MNERGLHIDISACAIESFLRSKIGVSDLFSFVRTFKNEANRGGIDSFMSFFKFSGEP